MTRSESLIIPGPDGDDLLDVNAAARMLGVKASTLRSHQYQDRRHEGRDPWPQPEDPDEVEIALPDGAGIEWARAIDELLLRSGGAGRPVTLWRRSVLAAFRAERTGVAVPLRDGAEGPVIGEAVLHGDGTFTASVTDPDAAARLQPSLKPGDVSFESSSVQSFGADPPAYVLAEGTPLWGGAAQPGDVSFEAARGGGKSSLMAQGEEAWAERNPDGTLIEVSREEGVKRLTATEVLERARLRREGKLDGS